MNKTIQLLLTIVAPFITKLIESTVIPKAKRKAYERLDDFTNDRIEDLAELVDKIQKEDDDIKKQTYLKGLKLGTATLRAIGNKLVAACDEFSKVLG